MDFRSIRSVPADAGSVAGILRDLKENVELLIGQRGSGSGYSEPVWSHWKPYFSGVVLSGYDTARYCIINKVCFYSFTANTKTLSGSGGVIKITLPIAVGASTGYQYPHGAIFNGSAWVNGAYMDIAPGTLIVNVYKTAAAGAWSASETGVCVLFNGCYEID